MKDKEPNSLFPESLALLAKLTSWQFEEVFITERDRQEFNKFGMRVRLARQREFALQVPMEDGELYLHYKIPPKGVDFYKAPDAHIIPDGKEMPERLKDVLTFNTKETDVMKNLGVPPDTQL